MSFPKTHFKQQLAALLLLVMIFGLLPGDGFAASSWNPTLLVNTETFQTIDDTDSVNNLELRFGDALREKLVYDRSNQRFKFTRSLFVAGNTTITGTLLVNIGNSTAGADTALETIGIMSGSTVYAQRSFSGAGLTDCDTGGTSKLLWDATTARFSCGTDQTGAGGGSNWSNTGSLQAAFDTRFVNQSGDSMTGALGINVTGGNQATLGLRVRNTASGAHLHAEQTLTSSGQLVVEGNLTFGDALADAITINAATWTFANDTNFAISGGVNGLSFDTSTLSVDASNNRIGIGTTAPDTALDVVGTMSGSALQGAGLVDCDTASTSKVLYDITTGKFSCGTDQGGGSVSLTRINGSSGAAGSDITWQNLTSNSADCTTASLCSSAMTTTSVGAGTWKYKYTLIYQTAATTTGIGFAIDHTGTVGQVQHLWYHATTGGAAATGIGDDDTATSAGQLMEGKAEGVDNTLIGSVTAGVATANADHLAILEGIIVVTVSGDMQLKLQSEVAASAVRIMADSTLELIKVE